MSATLEYNAATNTFVERPISSDEQAQLNQLAAMVLTPLQQFQKACRQEREATDATFRRIQEAILGGRTTAADPVTKEWLDYFYSCTLGMKAEVAGVIPVRPIVYPAGTGP